jgi:transposase-like protein
MGLKTVGQIAREYQVHPVQVTQWKGILRDHLPDLFESPQAASPDQEQLIAQLHEKIGQLSMEVDWLKKKCKQLGLSGPGGS